MLNFLVSAMNAQTIVMIVLLAIMVIVLIVLPMFTNKRRNKAINDLHSSLRPGDIIKTVGGIVGTIVEIKEISPVDKEMVVETGVGDNKSTMVFDVQAVYQVLSKVDAPVSVAEPAPSTETAVQEEPKAEEPVTKADFSAETESIATEEIKEEPPVEEKNETPVKNTRNKSAKK